MMRKTFGARQAADTISQLSGKPMSNSKLTVLLRELYPARGRGGVWELDESIVKVIACYWIVYGWKKSAHPDIATWAAYEKVPIPKLPGTLHPVAPSPVLTITQAELSGIIRAAIKEAMAQAPVPAPKLLGEPLPEITRDNDARVRLIEDSIAVFQRDHEISRATCMDKLRELAHIAHPFWAGIHQDEEYPLYLRKSGHIAEFIHELPGYLDAIHDQLTARRATA
jgi:hypothetical protein